MSNHKYLKKEKLRGKSDADLQNLVRELKTEAFENRFKLVTGALEDYCKVPAAKKNLATVLTVLKERQLEAQYGAGWRKAVRGGTR
jgi:large subunit ribosomal protein L29